jgi:hypothetical protein
MKRRVRSAVIVAGLLLLAPVVIDLPGGLWLLAPLGAAAWWVDSEIERTQARDRWFNLDCVAAIRGSHQRPEASQAAMRRHSHDTERQALLRHLQVFGESAHLVLNSRNAGTVRSRRSLAQQAHESALAMQSEFSGLDFWAALKKKAEEIAEERPGTPPTQG